MTKFYAREVASGLAYLHSQNILHNDLKAENILLTQMGHVRITDFGTSKVINNCDVLTGMEGTPGNVPPEMLTEKGNQINPVKYNVLKIIKGTHFHETGGVLAFSSTR